MAKAFSEQIKTSIGLAKEEAQKKLTVKLGKIVGEGKTNYRYDVVINGELIPEVPDPSRTEPKYTDGTAVNIVIPFGNESARYISDKSDYTLPEQTVTTMSTKKKVRPVVIPKYLYMALFSKSWSEQGKIAKYTIDGIFQWVISTDDFTPDYFYPSGICYLNNYIYVMNEQRGIFKYNLSGDFIETVINSSELGTYAKLYTDGTYFYQKYVSGNGYISRMNITTKERVSMWITYPGETLGSIATNSQYIISSTGASKKFLLFDYSGNFVKEIYTGFHPSSFTCDEENIYFLTSGIIKIVNIATGSITASVSASGLSSVFTTDDTYLYRATSTYTYVGISTNTIEIYDKTTLELINSFSTSDFTSGGIRGIVIN